MTFSKKNYEFYEMSIFLVKHGISEIKNNVKKFKVEFPLYTLNK